MATTSSAGGSSSTSNNKRAIKRKLDDSILKKARAVLGLPLESQDDDDGEKNGDEPSLKWRKPRHNTAEGQIYVKNKEKRKVSERESNLLSSTPGKSKKEDKKSKKKRKNKKKKKTSGTAATAPTESVKDPDSEKRHGMEAVAYIQLWSTNRDHWKFEKRKQTWLLKNCLNASLIDDTRFEILLEYIASVKGAAKEATLKEMQSLVRRKEMLSDQSASSSLDKEERVGNEETKDSSISDVMYDRARQIIQMLSD